MKRSMMQVYVKGSNEAILFYQKAFGAELVASYLNPDGTPFWGFHPQTPGWGCYPQTPYSAYCNG